MIVFADESGLSQRPPIRQTWAPRGQTPVITHSFSWQKLSMNAALVYHWDGKPVNLYFEIIPGSYDQHRLVDFIDSLSAWLRRTISQRGDRSGSKRTDYAESECGELLGTRPAWSARGEWGTSARPASLRVMTMDYNQPSSILVWTIIESGLF